jgi:hypothetical protein
MLKIEKEGKIELIPIEQPKPCQCTSQLSADKRTYPLANAKLSAETQNGNLPSFFIWFENAGEPKVWATNALSQRRA